MKEFRVTVKLRNNRLLSLREEMGLSQSLAAKAIGISLAYYGALECCREAPRYATGKRAGQWKDCVLSIARFYDRDAGWIFPDAVSSVHRTTLVRRLNGLELQSLTDGRDPRLNLLPAALETLSERERGMLSNRFGLESGHMKTLDECAELDKGISGERARQIQNRALRKLRAAIQEAVKLGPGSSYAVVAMRHPPR